MSKTNLHQQSLHMQSLDQRDFDTINHRHHTSRVMTRRDHRTRGHGASQSELPMANDQENVPQRVEPQPTLTSKQQAKAAELAEQIEREQKECGPRFELIEKIGEGTYGIVFKAQDHKLNQVSMPLRLNLEQRRVLSRNKFYLLSFRKIFACVLPFW